MSIWFNTLDGSCEWLEATRMPVGVGRPVEHRTPFKGAECSYNSRPAPSARLGTPTTIDVMAARSLSGCSQVERPRPHGRACQGRWAPRPGKFRSEPRCQTKRIWRSVGKVPHDPRSRRHRPARGSRCAHRFDPDTAHWRRRQDLAREVPPQATRPAVNSLRPLHQLHPPAAAVRWAAESSR